MKAIQLFLFGLTGHLAGCAAETPQTEYANVPRYFNIPFVTTPDNVVHAMLDLANVGPGDVVYDLGSGDGRIPIAAVHDFGAARGMGIEIDPKLVALAQENAKAVGVADRVSFRKADIYDTDYTEASVVTMYLADDANKVLRPRLEAQLAPGSRIVSHLFKMGDWTPDKTVKVGDRTIYLWIVD